MNNISFILLSFITSYLVSQIIKFFLNNDKSVKSLILKQGGAVSSHSAVMISLISSILLTEWLTTSFAIAVIFSLIVYSQIIQRRRETDKHSIWELILGGCIGLIITLIYFFSFIFS